MLYMHIGICGFRKGKYFFFSCLFNFAVKNINFYFILQIFKFNNTKMLSKIYFLAP